MARPPVCAGIEVAAADSIGSELSKESAESSEAVGLLAAMSILTLVLGSLVAMGLPIINAVVGLAVALGDVVLLSAVPTTGPATVATADLLEKVRGTVVPGVEKPGGITSFGQRRPAEPEHPRRAAGRRGDRGSR